jgi:hypothetical protein
LRRRLNNRNRSPAIDYNQASVTIALGSLVSKPELIVMAAMPGANRAIVSLSCRGEDSKMVASFFAGKFEPYAHAEIYQMGIRN